MAGWVCGCGLCCLFMFATGLTCGFVGLISRFSFLLLWVDLLVVMFSWLRCRFGFCGCCFDLVFWLRLGLGCDCLIVL